MLGKTSDQTIELENISKGNDGMLPSIGGMGQRNRAAAEVLHSLNDASDYIRGNSKASSRQFVNHPVDPFANIDESKAQSTVQMPNTNNQTIEPPQSDRQVKFGAELAEGEPAPKKKAKKKKKKKVVKQEIEEDFFVGEITKINEE